MSYVSMLGAFSASASASAQGGRTMPTPARPGESLVDGGDHGGAPAMPNPTALIANVNATVAAVAAARAAAAQAAASAPPSTMYTSAPVAPRAATMPAASAALERPAPRLVAATTTPTGSHSGALLVFGLLGAVAIAWLVTRNK